MRRTILFGFLVIVFAAIAPSVMAGQVPWCEAIKADSAYKGLYGLCNAYWNETDDEKLGLIWDAWEEKTDLPMPSPALSCGCWSGVVLEEVGTYTQPVSCYIFSDGNLWAFFETANDTPPPDKFFQTFISAGEGCTYDAYYIDDLGVVDTTRQIEDTGDDGEACQQEMVQILNKWFPDGIGGADCFEL